MLNKALENEIIKQLGRLEKSQQNKVLTYIKNLLKSREVNNEKLLQFAGTFEKSSLQQMQQAIEEGCENIDKNEW